MNHVPEVLLIVLCFVSGIMRQAAWVCLFGLCWMLGFSIGYAVIWVLIIGLLAIIGR